jgi:hypothetical protein
MRRVSVRSFSTRSSAGFGAASRRERYQADVFFADLTGSSRTGRRRRRMLAETYSERDWEDIRTPPFAEEGA